MITSSDSPDLRGVSSRMRVDELLVALRTREAKLAPKRVAQKREALLRAVHDVRLLRVQRQPMSLHPLSNLRQSGFGFFCVRHRMTKSSAYRTIWKPSSAMWWSNGLR